MFRVIQRVSSLALHRTRQSNRDLNLQFYSASKKKSEPPEKATKLSNIKPLLSEPRVRKSTDSIFTSPSIMMASKIISQREKQVRLPVSHKPLVELSKEELDEWIKELPITDEELSSIRSRGWTGQAFWAIFRGKNERKLFTDDLASRLRTAMDQLTEHLIWAPLPTTETETSIKAKMTIIAASVTEAMKKSHDLAYQQRTINKQIKAPLPLSSDALNWSPYYFDDVVTHSSQLLTNLEKGLKEIRTSSAQEKFMIALVQMSGVGKTHLALSHAKLCGGVLMWFSSDNHLNILQQAEDFIAAARSMVHTDENQPINEQFRKEEEFRRVAVQVTKLIPLTFLEFAKYFFEEASIKSLDKKDYYLAFLRATLNGGKDLLFNMFVKNLAYVNNESFSNFEAEMLDVAFKYKLTTFIYDEAHKAESMMTGQFLHDAGTLKEKFKSRVLEQLRIEQANRFQQNADFPRPTSIFYLLVLAMEQFTKLGARPSIPQIMLSTSFSLLNLLPKGDISRERLPIIPFNVQEDNRKLLARYFSLIKTAFGQEGVALLKQQHMQLVNRFASRPLYLFKSFELLPASKRNQTLEDLFKEWMSTTEEHSMSKAENYVLQSQLWATDKGTLVAGTFNAYKENAKPHLQLSVVMASLTTKKGVEVKPFVIQELVRLGLASWKSKSSKISHNMLQSIDQNKEVSEAPKFDYYIRLSFRGLAYENLLSMFRYLATAPNTDIGELGECFVALIFKRLSINGRPLSELAPHCNIPPGIKNLKLPKGVIVTSPKDCGLEKHQHHIFTEECYSKLHPFNYCPTTMLGPDSIFLLQRGKKTVGFLVVQVKNYEDSIGIEVFLKKALPVINYVNFYHSGKNVAANRLEWSQMLNKCLENKVWVRAVYAKGFTDEVWHMVRKWNSTDKGRTHPILLITPDLPELRNEGFENLGMDRTAGAPPAQINLSDIQVPEEFNIDYKMPGRHSST